MKTEVKPIAGKVKAEMRRQTSKRRFVTPVVRVFMQLFMFLLTIGGCLFGIAALWVHAIDDPRFRMDGETLALAGAVRECPESVADLERIGKRFSGRSLLDPTLIADIEAAYGESVWTKRVTRMRRRFPNRMEVELLLRIPVAQVWCDNAFWLIDSDAVLLPVGGSQTPYRSLPQIVGVTADTIGGHPQFGKQWDDDGIGGALGILRSFWGSPLAEVLQPERVVVNAGTFRSEATRKRFEVVASGGAVVRWGTYNSGNHVDELTSSEKLWLLQELLRSKEALRPGICFDVRTRLPGYALLQ